MTLPRKAGLIAACAIGGLLAAPAFAQEAPAPTRQELAAKPWMNTRLSAAERNAVEKAMRAVVSRIGIKDVPVS